ncbi:MAG: Hsp33 family molecular chaperone HslO [Erysipelotrichaceae bacterium]
MKDILVKALARNKRVRIYVCTTTNLLEEARNKHGMWPTASATLGRAMSGAIMMAGMLKSADEKITLNINGGGPIGTVLVSANNNGEVKGFVSDPLVQYTYNETGKLAVGVAVGTDGYLKVIKDINMKNEFSGSVRLVSGEIGDDLAYYFAQSEQTPSVVSLGVLVNDDNSILSSGGIIIQMLPDATEEDIVVTEQLLKSLKSVSTLINEGNDAIMIAKSLYSDVEILEETPLMFKCHCSKEKMVNALRTIDKEEIKAIIEEDHGCEMYCEYCNSAYQITEEELKELL